MSAESEKIEFVADEPPLPADDASVPVWKLLIVDDDEEVHEATRFALSKVRINDRRLHLIHAHSAEEGATVMVTEPDIAVILLDVVMESPDAGLLLVQRIRETLHRSEVRIILRTGQPGHAPELQVIRDYDINDYKTKAELTHTRLVTTLIAAIRSFEQLRAISENRRGLELIVSAASDLMQAHGLNSFAKGVLMQIAALLHLPGDGIVCTQKGSPFSDAEPDVVHIVAAAGRLSSYIGQPLEQLREPEIVTAIKECMTHQRHSFGPAHTALYLRGRNHEAAVYVRSEKPLAPIDRQLVEVFASNVSSCFGNVKLVERLNFLAYHDPLTGLPNRSRFLDHLATVGALAPRGEVVCLLDIDHFTDINNALGHAVGDHLLIAVARRLAVACRDCRLARVGTDTFGLVGPEEQLAPEHLLALLQEPFTAGEQQLQIDAALGYCRITKREAGDRLFKQADMALTQARLNPNARLLYFTPEMEERTHWRLDVIRHLRRDFLDGRLSVWYQPQVSLADGGIVGLEALARWPGVDDFIQPPAVFIPLAEDAGLIIDIGAWVLDQSCATFRRLQASGHAPRHMAVNVSMPQIRLPDFPERVKRTLAAYGMQASSLELEITESLLLTEPLVVLRNLQALKREGVQITIDDFGTGYSSLGYLRQLPIDCLKIDRSFVLEIDDGRGDLFAETIVALARKLGLETVAEGVETPAQVNRLHQLGCDHAQGFLYAKPMPAEALDGWINGQTMH